MKVRFGKPERLLIVLLIVQPLVSVVRVPELLRLAVTLALFVVAAIVFMRWLRDPVQRMLWKLRNRLVVAYIFMALVPVVLITVLFGLGGWLLGGQLCLYLVTSELERDTEFLRQTTAELSVRRNTPEQWLAEIAPHLQTRYPGLQLSVVEGGRHSSYPPSSNVEAVPAEWPEGSGLTLRSDGLWGWAYVNGEGRAVFAAFPITREYLGDLSPDLGESTIIEYPDLQVVLHDSLPGAGTSHNRLLPPVNWLDQEIFWFAPVPVRSWQQPAEVDNKWISIRTRPSAIFRTVFSQKLDITNELVYITFITVAILFLVAEIIALIIGISMTRTITSAVHDLHEGTLRVRSGDLSNRIPISGKDQLADLATSFNQMTHDLQRLLRSEKERERLQAELEIAREVQNQLYPRTVPNMECVTVTAICTPARMVSGDYYDYQQIGALAVAIAIGDVAGKGISAALLMATVQSSFRSQLRGTIELAAPVGLQGASRPTVSTSSLVTNLNKQLYADTSPEKYATFFLGVYDDSVGTLTYTNAGHLPPVLVRGGGAERLEVNGTVVGAFPFASYGESRIELLRDDLIVFFTDGITEPENEYGEMFGEERLIEVIQRNAHRSEREVADSIVESVREWTGSDELQDDMTLLLVRRH